MEKKENKKMKKGLMIGALAVLLGVVGYTGGQTFAKYISTVELPSQSATVAKWGLTANAVATEMFGTKYNEVADTVAKVTTTDSGLVVKAATSTGNIVAPGTSGQMTITLSGQAEVDAKVTFAATLVDISLDTYHPISWTVTRATNGGAATKEVDAKVGAEVESYFDGLTFKYQAAETLNEVFVVSWVWAFEQGHDVEDTKLGKGEGDASLQFDLSITFTQIQDETL